MAEIPMYELAPPDASKGWAERGYFISRQVLDAPLLRESASACGRLMDDIVAGRETVAVVMPESTAGLEGTVSKVFRIHHRDTFAQLTRLPLFLAWARTLVGDDVNCFSGQFILKAPGAKGQPPHQDALYFPFPHDRILCVWIALSTATTNTSCLEAWPGSHRGPLLVHRPEQRDDANVGYMEVDAGTSSEREVLNCNAGDAVAFHSRLVHRSTDNLSAISRAALLFHFAPADVVDSSGAGLYDFVPVLRSGNRID